jgi:hypothetical protein
LKVIVSYGFLTRPHLQHQVEAMAVARDPAPLAQRIALAQATRLADFKVREANVEAQRARVTPEAGLTLYLAKLFGSDGY